MKKIIPALVGGFAILALGTPTMATGVDGVRGHAAPYVVSAKKRCRSGYIYDPRTKMCYPRGSH